MALDGWTKGEVGLVTTWQSVHRTVKAMVRGPWAIHRAPATISEDYRMTHAPTGSTVADASSREDLARLSERLDRLGGIDWLSADYESFRRHRRRALRVINRWRAKVEAAA